MHSLLGPIAADHHIIDHRGRLERAAEDHRRIVAASADGRRRRSRRPRDLLAAARRRFRPTAHGRGPDAVVVALPTTASAARSTRPEPASRPVDRAA